MDVKAALNEYKKKYVEKLKDLRDNDPDLFEKFQDLLIDEEYEELLSNEKIRKHFGIGVYSYFGSDNDVYLLYLISKKFGFDETITTCEKLGCYIYIDFLKLCVADMSALTIDGEVWDKAFSRLSTNSVITDPIHLQILSVGKLTRSANELLKGLSADKFIATYSLANAVIPQAENVELKIVDEMLKSSSFETDNVKVLDLSECDNLQVLDNNILSKVTDKIILPDKPDSGEIRIIGVSDKINDSLRIVRRSGVKIKCNKSITDNLRNHLDTI